MPAKSPVASASSTVPKLTRSPVSTTTSTPSSSTIVRIRSYWLPRVDVAHEEHAQRGVRLQRCRLVLLLQRRRQGDEVAQVGRHLGGPGLDVAEDALVALQRAEHPGRGERLLAAGLVGRVDREPGDRRGRQPAHEPHHDEGDRRAAPPQHGVPGEDRGHEGQRTEGEADHDRDRDVADRRAQLLRSGPQRREADPGPGEHLGDVGLDLRHGADAGCDPLELQSQVAERRGRHQLAAAQGVRVERDARLVVPGLRGGRGDRRRRGARERAGRGEPHGGEHVAHPPRADPVPGPPPGADRGDQRPGHGEEGDEALVEAERRPAEVDPEGGDGQGEHHRGGARDAAHQGDRPVRPGAEPRPHREQREGQRGDGRVRRPRTPCARAAAARRRRGWPPRRRRAGARPARRAGDEGPGGHEVGQAGETRPVVMIHRCGVADAASALIDSALGVEAARLGRRRPGPPADEGEHRHRRAEHGGARPAHRSRRRGRRLARGLGHAHHPRSGSCIAGPGPPSSATAPRPGSTPVRRPPSRPRMMPGVASTPTQVEQAGVDSMSKPSFPARTFVSAFTRVNRRAPVAPASLARRHVQPDGAAHPAARPTTSPTRGRPTRSLRRAGGDARPVPRTWRPGSALPTARSTT